MPETSEASETPETSKIPITILAPQKAKVVIDEKPYLLVSMSDETGSEWLRYRLYCHYRQIICFSKQSSIMSSAALQSASLKPEDIAEYNIQLDHLTEEWITINNVSCAISIKHGNPSFDDAAIISLVKSLSTKEKNTLIAIQDKLNGLDIIKELAAKQDEKTIDIEKISVESKLFQKFAPKEHHKPEKQSKLQKKLIKRLEKSRKSLSSNSSNLSNSKINS